MQYDQQTASLTSNKQEFNLNIDSDMEVEDSNSSNDSDPEFKQQPCISYANQKFQMRYKLNATTIYRNRYSVSDRATAAMACSVL